MAVLKSPREIELMRASGRVVRTVLDRIAERIRPGVTTGQLGALADEIIDAAGGEALFRGVVTTGTRFPFPSSICASVNDEVVHGIPGDRVLNEGDILSVDCGVRMRGYCGDAATTLRVGRVSAEVQRLLDVTQETLELAIGEIRPGRCWSELAAVMQAHVENAGFSVVREFVGHGIGQQMHEEPKVPNYADQKSRKGDFRLDPGLVIAVEPMVNMGTRDVKAGDATGWPQVTRDGKWSAHFEHTLAITAMGVDVLTDGR
jgi:methionyl aminopeptidase